MLQPNSKEIETIARVRGLNHEAFRMIKMIKALEEPEEGAFGQLLCELRADAPGDGESRTFA